MLFDTHAHINDPKLAAHQKQILECLGSSLYGVICPSYNTATCHSTLKLVRENPRVWGALGIHPSDEREWGSEIESFIRDNLGEKKIIALGEYGLDYHYDNARPMQQQQVMEAQLELARVAKMPSIFHVRQAFEDFFALLKRNMAGFSGGVIHCFDSNRENARRALDMGLYLGFTGLITYPKNVELQEVVKYVPLDRFLLETDCPYLTPEPFRGKLCTPLHVQQVAEKFANLKGLDRLKVEDYSLQNACTLFPKLVIK